MILSNVEVHRALDEGRLIITPEPDPRFPGLDGEHCPYNTHTVDLKLANEISVLEEGQINYDPSAPGSIAETLEKNSRTLTISEEQPYKLNPNVFALARTVEHIELPILEGSDRCLSARIEGKSSRARIGLLVHFTAPTVHPGFGGTLTLEMINLGPIPIILVPGMFIAQLIVEEVVGIPRSNPSQFQGQSRPSGRSD